MIYFYTLVVLFCSFLYGASAVLCKVGLQRGLDLGSAASKITHILGLLKNWVWLVGVFIGILANIIILQIQSVIDISIVYPILNFAYVFTLILGYLFLKERLTKIQWLGVIVITLGTAIILTIKDPVTGQATNIDYLKTVTLLALTAVVTLIMLARKSRNLNYEIMFAICAGICFGSFATYLKTNTNLIMSNTGSFSVLSLESIAQFLTLWPFFAIVLFSVVGFVCLQVAYSQGHVSVTVPLIAVSERVMNMASGYLVFGEAFSAVKIMGFATIILGALIITTYSIKKEATTSEIGSEYT